jgi:hypothetical protein
LGNRNRSFSWSLHFSLANRLELPGAVGRIVRNCHYRCDGKTADHLGCPSSEHLAQLAA